MRLSKCTPSSAVFTEIVTSWNAQPFCNDFTIPRDSLGPRRYQIAIRKILSLTFLVVSLNFITPNGLKCRQSRFSYSIYLKNQS